jgi:hypothetical protein
MKGILYKKGNDWTIRHYGDSSNVLDLPLHPSDTNRLFENGGSLPEYCTVDFKIIPVFIEKEPQNGECVDGDDIPHAKITDGESFLYSSIEELIIRWNIDGTKTAGSLTREIMDIIKKHITL